MGATHRPGRRDLRRWASLEGPAADGALARDLGRVARFLATTRRQILATGAARAGLAFLTALLALIGLATGAVLLWGPRPGLRFAVAGLAVSLFLGLVLALVLLAWRSRQGALALAREVEARAPELRDTLLTLVSRAAGPSSVESSLLALLAERAAGRVERLDRRQVVPTRGLGSLSLVLAALVAGAGLAFLLHGEQLAGGLTALFAGPRPAPPVENRGPLPVASLVGDLSVRYVPPDYTGLPDREEHNVSGDLRGLAGTMVVVRTRALVPTRELSLVLDSRVDSPLLFERGEDGVFEGRLTVVEPDSYRFLAKRPDGPLMVENTARLIEVVPDRPPELRLLAPAADSSVNRDERVELFGRVSDDFGVTQVLVAYERDGDAPVRRKLGEEAIGADGRVESVLDLAALDIRAGERIGVWLEATDNDGTAGPKTARSERRVLRVHSPDEKHAELLQREREMFERLLGLLGDRLVLPRPADARRAVAESLLEGVVSIVNHTQETLELFERLVADMGGDPLTSEDVLRDCAEIHSRLAVLASEERDLVRETLRREAASPGELGALLALNERVVAETEGAVLLLDRLVDRQHQERVLDEGRDLVRQGEALLDMMRELEAGGDEALRLRMLRELERLQTSLDRMAKETREQGKALPDERFNPAALGDRGTLNTLRSHRDALDEIRRLIQQNRLEEAHALLEEMLRGSREMLTGLEGEYAERGSERERRTARMVHRVRRRLDRVAGLQQRIQEDTAAQGEVFRGRVQNRLAGRRERFSQRQESRLDRLERLLRNVNREDLHPSDRSVIASALSWNGDIRRLLVEGDLGQAAQLAARLARALADLHSEVGQGAMFASDKGRKRALRKAERRVASALEVARELAQGLQAVLPDPHDVMSRAEQRRTARLGRQQASLQEQLDRLRRGLLPLAEEQPGLQGQLDRLLEQAGGSMGHATGELEALNPSMAEEHQSSVLQRLSAALEQLDRAARPEAPGAQGVGVGVHEESVAIPGADAYRVPAAFREEILRAMREEMPAGYRDLLEAYYESLIE